MHNKKSRDRDMFGSHSLQLHSRCADVAVVGIQKMKYVPDGDGNGGTKRILKEE
jgi:hypothetical protein